MGFTKSKVDSNLYDKVIDSGIVILLQYVDDLFLTGDEELIAGCKRKLSVEFEMKDLAALHFFFGLEVWQDSDGIFLGQGKYTVEILQRFGMMDCKSMPTPMMSNLKLLSDTSSDKVHSTIYRQMIGSLMYLTNTRSYICFAVNTLSQFMVDPRRVHWIAAKHVMRYLTGTVEYGLSYNSDHEINLQGYTDADWAGSVTNRKSTSGCCFSLGSAVISWLSRKQSSVALSTVEEEYMVACLASGEVVWLRKMIFGLFEQAMDVTISGAITKVALR